MFQYFKLLQHNRQKIIENCYRNWLPKGMKVLDIGCGDSVLTYYLSKQFSMTIYGCDVENFLRYPIHFTLMKSQNILPYKGRSFDFVMFNDVLHHTTYKSQKALLSEAVRVTKKGILIMENIPCLSTYIFDFLINKFSHPKMNIPYTFRTPKQWLTFFSGFSVEIEYKIIPKPITSPFPRIAFYLRKKI
jgi:ubiquinone/menaquinone biosynthesis C-methylase UbiE